MSVLATIGRIVRRAFGYRYLEIAEDLPGRVALRYGHTTTTFDRKTGKVEQNGRPVAMVSLVERIEVHRPFNHQGPPNWYVTVQISGHRQVEVGQSTDELDASIVAARISKVTERPVVVNAS